MSQTPNRSTYYYRAPLRDGAIATGMYCASDTADTIEIARNLRGIWETPGYCGDRVDATAIIRVDPDPDHYQGWRRTIAEVVPCRVA